MKTRSPISAEIAAIAGRPIPHPVILPMGDPRLYVTVSPPQTPSTWFGPSWGTVHEKIAKVHVISPSAGGEVRGYWLARGELWPCNIHLVEWPELDAAVQEAIGIKVHAPGERP